MGVVGRPPHLVAAPHGDDAAVENTGSPLGDLSGNQPGVSMFAHAADVAGGSVPRRRAVRRRHVVGIVVAAIFVVLAFTAAKGDGVPTVAVMRPADAAGASNTRIGARAGMGASRAKVVPSSGDTGVSGEQTSDKEAAPSVAKLAPQPKHVAASSREEIFAYLKAGCAPALARGTERLANCVEVQRYVAAWVDRLSNNALAARTWTVVNVGANKGYALASALDGLGVKGHTAAGTGEAIFTYAANDLRLTAPCHPQLCGGCCECLGDGAAAAERQRTLPAARRPTTWAAYAYEPAVSNVRFLKAVFETGAGDAFAQRVLEPEQAWRAEQPGPTAAGGQPAAEPQGGVTVEHMFVGNTNTDVDFPDCGLGAEDCHVHAHPGRGAGSGMSAELLRVEGEGHVPAARRRGLVKAARLDDALPKDVRYIDVLVTDAEGSDYAVADGAAERFLNRAAVGLLIFEVPLRGERSLGRQLAKLERAGFVCYMPLAPESDSHNLARSLLRVTHGCLPAEFEDLRGWHNVVCANLRERHLVDALRHLEEEPPTLRATCNATLAAAAAYSPLQRKASHAGLSWQLFADCSVQP